MFSFEIQCIVSSSWVLIDLPFTFDGGGGYVFVKSQKYLFPDKQNQIILLHKKIGNFSSNFMKAPLKLPGVIFFLASLGQDIFSMEFADRFFF